MEVVIKPKKITKENFAKFGDVISTQNIKPMDINNGYAKRFDNLADINTSNNNATASMSIFSALKRSFPMKIDMMEKHPLGSQAFIPMKETNFISFVSPSGDKPNISKIESFVVSPGIGINYKPNIWHFPLISTENMNFLVVDRKGAGDNLIIYNFEKEKIILEY
jgi:ureidoglycolate lyase